MKQTTKTLLTLLVLVAVGGAIGLYAYYGVQEKDRKDEERKDHDDRLFAPAKLGEKSPDGGAIAVEFTSLAITYKGATTTLSREPGKPWRLVSPVQAPADKLAVDAVVSQLQLAKFKSVIEENPDEAALKKYGLDQPRFEVEAQAVVGEAKEPRKVKLSGGIENTYDGSVYMQRDGQKTVYAAEGGARYAFQKTTLDLRDKEVFPYALADLKRIEVKTPNNHFKLEKDEKKAWHLREPTDELADTLTLTAMIAGLKGDHATAFPPDTAEQRTAAGLDQAQVEASFETDKGEQVSLKVNRPAAADAGDSSTYALVEGPNGTELATLAKVVELDRNPGDLRDRTLVQFKKEDVAKIVFHPAASADGGANPELVVERGARPDGGLGDEWRVTAPRPGKAKTFKVSSIMWTLGSAKWEKAGEDHPKDWSKFGIDARARSVALFGADGKELARLTFGSEVPNERLTWVRGSRDQVLEADLERVKDDLPVLVGDLIDTTEAPDAGASGAGKDGG